MQELGETMCYFAHLVLGEFSCNSYSIGYLRFMEQLPCPSDVVSAPTPNSPDLHYTPQGISITSRNADPELS
jgi:hypothetical protein